jgi:hypothetical protein
MGAHQKAGPASKAYFFIEGKRHNVFEIEHLTHNNSYPTRSEENQKAKPSIPMPKKKAKQIASPSLPRKEK